MILELTLNFITEFVCYRGVHCNSNSSRCHNFLCITSSLTRQHILVDQCCPDRTARFAIDNLYPSLSVPRVIRLISPAPNLSSNASDVQIIGLTKQENNRGNICNSATTLKTTKQNTKFAAPTRRHRVTGWVQGRGLCEPIECRTTFTGQFFSRFFVHGRTLQDKNNRGPHYVVTNDADENLLTRGRKNNTHTYPNRFEHAENTWRGHNSGYQNFLENDNEINPKSELSLTASFSPKPKQQHNSQASGFHGKGPTVRGLNKILHALLWSLPPISTYLSSTTPSNSSWTSMIIDLGRCNGGDNWSKCPH